MTTTVTDRWGCDFTAPGLDAAAAYEHLVDGYVTFAADLAPDRLQAALADEPAPMAKVLSGGFMVLSHQPGSQERAAKVAASLADTELLPRERRHVEALTHWAAGDLDGACASWRGCLEQWPTDVLALRLQHFVFFTQGRLDEMLTATETALTAWDDDLPRRSYLGGMQAFALEELGRYDEAEELGRAAVAADATDLWSIHSVAHVLQMQGRVDDGLDWFDGREPVLRAGGNFAGHLWWHRSLYRLAAGDVDGLLADFEGDVFDGTTDDGLTLTNAISLLARLHFTGVDVSDRWDRLVELSMHRLGQHSHPFNDCHFVLATTLAGRGELADQLIDGMTTWATRDDDAARVLNVVGLDVARALRDIDRRPARTAEILAANAADIRHLGGSHAQRDVFTQAQRFATAAT